MFEETIYSKTKRTEFSASEAVQIIAGLMLCRSVSQTHNGIDFKR